MIPHRLQPLFSDDFFQGFGICPWEFVSTHQRMFLRSLTLMQHITVFIFNFIENDLIANISLRYSTHHQGCYFGSFLVGLNIQHHVQVCDIQVFSVKGHLEVMPKGIKKERLFSVLFHRSGAKHFLPIFFSVTSKSFQGP